MNNKQILFLLILAAIPFIIYSLSSEMVGADSFFYILQACGQWSHETRDIVFDSINSVMPCNYLVMKLFLFGCFATFIFGMAKIGEFFDKEKGWLLGIIASCFTLIFYEFAQYQNEPIAYALIVWVIYFVLQASKHKFLTKERIFYTVISLGLYVIAGLAWKGTIYIGIIYLFYIPEIFVILIPLFIYEWNALFWFLTADQTVAFYKQWISVVYLGPALFFVFGALKAPKKITALAIILIIPALFVQRMYELAVPFFLILTFYGLMLLKLNNKTLVTMLIYFGIFMAIFWGMQTYNTFPNSSDQNLLDFAVVHTDSVQNSFGPGYWLAHNGLKISSYGSPIPNQFDLNGYVILERGLVDYNEDLNQYTPLITSTSLKLYYFPPKTT